MKVHVTGVSHRTAPVEVRERVAFSERQLPGALAELKSVPGMSEGVILSTCNRVEVAVAIEDDRDGRRPIVEFLARSREVEPGWIEPHLYHFDGSDAIRHIFRVASSLDSMVVGEPQILGQMKSAWAIARQAGCLGGVLDLVFTRAFSVAKRVRSETEIAQSAVSVSSAAVELARQIFDSLKDKKILLIGAGKMSELAARHLVRGGIREIFVTNRSAERAQRIASEFNARIVDYHTFVDVLPEVDVVIASSGAPHYILHKDQMRHVLSARRNRPMFLIDIAVPRNIDPAVNELEFVFLYDIDDLQKVVDSNRRTRHQGAEDAERIVDDEVQRTVERLLARDAAPLIVSLQKQLEAVRQAEIERIRAKLGPLTPQQEEAIEALTRGIINKIAHAPIAELRRAPANNSVESSVDVIRRIFRIET